MFDDQSSVPGCLFPFSVLTLLEADFIQLSEKGMGNMFLITILCPQQKLHPLSWCVHCSKCYVGGTRRKKRVQQEYL